MQEDVREKWRDDSTLRRSRDGARDLTLFHHTHFEPVPQQLEHAAIRDASLDELHQLVVIDAPEVVADVGIEDVMTTLGTQLSQGLERHRRTSLRAEAVRARKKIRLEDRLHHQLRRHLHHSVSYR